MFVISLYRFKVFGHVQHEDLETDNYMTLEEARKAFFEGSFEPILHSRRYKWADADGNPIGDFLDELPEDFFDLPSEEQQNQMIKH